MRPEPNAISCAVCRDLAPLVADGVAAPTAPPWCAPIWRPARPARPNGPPWRRNRRAPRGRNAPARRAGRRPRAAPPAPPPEKRTALLLAAGVVGGTLLTYSRYSVLVFLFFPLVCGVLCWQRDPAWRVLPPLTLAVSALAAFISSQLEHSYTNLWAAVRGALGWGVFTAALCLVGALAGYWLAYAFKKERKKNETVCQTQQGAARSGRRGRPCHRGRAGADRRRPARRPAQPRLGRAPGHCPGRKALPGPDLHRAGQLGRQFF